MSNKLNFEKCSEVEWDLILKNSHQSNLFQNFLFKNCGQNFTMEGDSRQ